MKFIVISAFKAVSTSSALSGKLINNVCSSKFVSATKASAYEACDRTCTPLHMPKTLEMSKKKTCLVWFKKFQEVWQIPHKKQHCFLFLTFYNTKRSYKKFMCVYFLFHWFSGENCMFLCFLHKGWQTSNELKRNMNDGTIVFLMSLLIVFSY